MREQQNTRVLRPTDWVKRAVAALLAVSTLVVPAIVDAKPIAEYDRMSVDDRMRYVTLVLNRTIDYLKEQGQLAAARRVSDSFNDPKNPAMQRLFENIETGRKVGYQTGKTVEVEHAVLMTLREIGVDVPKGVAMTLGKDFKPTTPPR